MNNVPAAESGMRIRNASLDDAGPISALLEELAREFIVQDFTDAGRAHLLAQFSVTEMVARLQSREYRFHVADDGATLVGVVAVRAATHLQYLFVAKSHHRQGLARKLWATAHHEAINNGNLAATFTVNASAYAVPAYERLASRCAGPAKEADGVRFHPMELGERKAKDK